MIRKLGPDDFAKGMMFVALFIAGLVLGAASAGWENLRDWISALSGWFAGGAAVWIGLTQIRPLLEQISISGREEARQSLKELTQLETNLEAIIMDVSRATDPLTDTDRIISASIQSGGGQDLMHNIFVDKRLALEDTLLQARVELKTAQIPPIHFSILDARRKKILRALSKLTIFARRLEDYSSKVMSDYTFHAQVPDVATANNKFFAAMQSKDGIERQGALRDGIDDLSIEIGRAQDEIRSAIEEAAAKHHSSPTSDE